LPSSIRNQLSLRSGDPLAVVVKDGVIILSPAVVTSIERYTDARIAAFAQEAKMTPSEIKNAAVRA